MANLDSIKRQARKEAWYSDSFNPFGKINMGRSGTFPQGRERDLEAGNRRNRGMPEDESPLSHIQSEPNTTIHSRGPSDGATIPRSSKEEYEMTSGGAGVLSNNKPTEGGSDETAVDRVSTRQRSSEEKARHRFLGKFRKDKANNEDTPEADDVPKKRPWYKGKILKHEPYTVRNQINRTIFNSWVNILLLAAPAGIACNYAGVDGKIIFVVNFIAIIPLAGMLSFATEEIALHVGESLGGLLNASFG